MPQPEFVSMISLIATPTQFDGKLVRVIGFLVADFEATGLFLAEPDARNAVTKNGIWLEIEASDHASFSHSYVIVEGTFDSESRGHLSMWSGTLRNVTRLQAWRG
jgi:hypothetical protein